MTHLRVALIGAGKIALANHLPGLASSGRASITAIAETDPAARESAAQACNINAAFADYRDVLKRDDVDAVIVAAPNHTHRQIVLDAAAAKKHILCEKPLALDHTGAADMLRAVESAGVRHMTAFTYRFVPAMRYLHHLVQRGDLGELWHFRAQRFQDWGDRPLGWRQVRSLAGTGELADMLSHRIDYAHHLVGPIARLAADMRTLIPTRGGRPSDVDDWVAMLVNFVRGATGVLESTKLATGRGEGHRGADLVEINGSDASAVYSTQRPLELLIGRRGDADLSRIDVPREFWKWPTSRRDESAGDPLVTFRYDQDVEFVDAILANRPCNPSFAEGVAAQAVMDAAVLAAREKCWVDVT